MDNHHPKIRPFTCYFCNKLVDNDTEYGHVSNCGSVLEPCVNKCGSYVPRNMKARHMKECKNQMSKSTPKLNSDNGYDYQNHETVAIVHNPNAGFLASTLPHTSRVKMKPDPHQPSINARRFDLTELLNKFQNLDQSCRQLSQNMLILKTKHQEGAQTQHNAHMQTQMQLEKLQYQTQIMNEAKRTMEMQMENLKQEMKYYQKFQNETGNAMENLQSVQGIAHKTEADLRQMQKQFHEERLENRETFNGIHEKLNEFKDYFAQENAVVGALWTDYKADIETLAQEIIDIQKNLTETKTKQSSLIFDLRTVTQISAETSDRLEIQERVLGEIKKELSQFKLDLQSLDESSTNESSKLVTASPGRLVWKIANFGAKMEDAKDNDIVIKSPIFYTHDYGYKVRLQVYLNGIKKWKGRHMIACLHVLKGEYDLLLRWPCFIEGTLILRDLYNHSNPNDFSKYISAKRQSGDEEEEEPQESSTQYIFVPHTTLTKQNFVREDTLFIEIRINSTNKTRDETEL